MAKKELDYASEIVQVSPWKAFTGFAVDFFLSFTLVMLGTFFLSPLLEEAMGAKEAKEEMREVLSSSSLCSITVDSANLEWHYYIYGHDQDRQLDEKGKIKEPYGGKDEAYVGKYPFELYVDILFDYYSSFSLKEGNAFITLEGKENPAVSSYSDEERGKYIGETIFEITADSSSFFAFDIDSDGNPKYDVKPVLNSQNPVVKALEDEGTALYSAAKINAFFIHSSPSYDGVYELTYANMEIYQPRYLSILEKANGIAYLAKLPVRLIPPFLFLFLLPVVINDGKSIGRLLSGTAVIDFGGYCAPKWKIAIHQGLLYLPILLALLPYDTLDLFSIIAVYLVNFLVMNLSPTKRGIHEILAGTITVNDLESSYFSSKKEYDEYVASLPKEEKTSRKKKERQVVDSSLLKEEPSKPKEIEEKKETKHEEVVPQEEVKEIDEPKADNESIPEDEDAFLDERK